MDYKTAIIVLGPQGAGKGTQAKILSKEISAPIIEAGEILRKEKNSNSSLGKTIASYIDKGSLVPDDVLKEVFIKQISHIKHSNLFIFDGIPRTFKQKQIFDEVLKHHKFNQLIVIYISLDDNHAIERLKKRGRYDDTPELIKKRLDIYHSKTEPVISTYNETGHLIKIDGSPSIKSVAKLIKDKISELI